MKTHKDSIDTAHRIIAAAGSRSSALECMQLTQSALNIANALAAITRLPPDPTSPQK